MTIYYYETHGNVDLGQIKAENDFFAEQAFRARCELRSAKPIVLYKLNEKGDDFVIVKEY